MLTCLNHQTIYKIAEPLKTLKISSYFNNSQTFLSQSIQFLARVIFSGMTAVFAASFCLTLNKKIKIFLSLPLICVLLAHIITRIIKAPKENILMTPDYRGIAPVGPISENDPVRRQLFPDTPKQ